MFWKKEKSKEIKVSDACRDEVQDTYMKPVLLKEKLDSSEKKISKREQKEERIRLKNAGKLEKMRIQLEYIDKRVAIEYNPKEVKKLEKEKNEIKKELGRIEKILEEPISPKLRKIKRTEKLTNKMESIDELLEKELDEKKRKKLEKKKNDIKRKIEKKKTPVVEKETGVLESETETPKKKVSRKEKKAAKLHRKRIAKIEEMRIKVESIDDSISAESNPRKIKRLEKEKNKLEKQLKKMEEPKTKNARIFRKIEKLNSKVDNIYKQLSTESNERKIKKLNKNRDKTEERIEKLKIRTLSKTQLSAKDKLWVKLKGSRIWIIVLWIVIVIAVAVAAVWLYRKYMDENYLSGRYYSEMQRSMRLEQRVAELENDKTRLEQRVAELESDKSWLESEKERLEDENREYGKKARFMDEYIKVVEDDAYKTYHKYGCEYFDGAFWAYNKEQVINNDEYYRCPYCN